MRLQNLSGCILLLCILLSIFSIGQGTQIDKDITNALATNIVDRVNCSTTSDCIQHGLTSSICQHSICVSKNLFPLSIAEILSSMAAFLSVILAAGSGLGGGGLLVPAYILTLDISSHEAIPLSKATIFGGAIASFIVNVRSRHPLSRDRPLIDYETMLLMEPMTLAGTIIGVNLNKVFPEWLITLCVVWLLTKTSLRTYAKGKKILREEIAAEVSILHEVVGYWRLLAYQYQFEHFDAVARAYLKWKSFKRARQGVVNYHASHSRRNMEHVSGTSIQDLEGDTDLSDDYDNSDEEIELMSSGVKKSDFVSKALDELTKKRNTVPIGDLGVLCGTWAVLLLFSLAKGGHGADSIIGIQCGSITYWSLVIVSFPFFVFITLYFGAKISRAHTRLRALGYEYTKGDMVWSRDTAIWYPALCTMAGLAAGLLGIGGGMVKGPLLLEMGLLPQVASATSSTMILFTSSATTVQFIIMGTLSIEHALWHGTVGFVAGMIGQFGVSYLIKKYRKTAFVIFMIAVVVGTSGLTMGVLGAKKVTIEGFGGLRPLCKPT